MRRVYLVLATAVTLLFAAGLNGQALDERVPDSAFFLTPYYLYEDCSGAVKQVVPLYLFTDDSYNLVVFDVEWTGSADYDTLLVGSNWTKSNLELRCEVDTAAHSAQFMVGRGLDFFAPGEGILAELVLHTYLGDTCEVFCPENSLRLHSSIGLRWWSPAFENLQVATIMPDTIAVIPGDIDCSGFVSISDAIYPLCYIFGGCPRPYDINSIDVNSDCCANISDVVYLITYIFAQGSPPQPGCVVK